jgi:hypothetical protein
MIKFVITGLPKTGTTYLQNILQNYYEKPVGGEGRLCTSAWLHIPSMYDSLSSLKTWFNFSAYCMNGWIVERKDADNGKINRKVLEDKFESIRIDLIKMFVYKYGNHLIGEKQPLLLPDAIPTLKKIFPDTKIIFMRREINDWIFSNLYHAHRTKDKIQNGRSYHVLFTDKAFVHFDKFLKGEEKSPITPVNYDKLAKHYNMMNQKFSETFPEAFCVAYENLFYYPEETIEDLLRHLDGNVEGKKMIKAIEDAKHSTNLPTGFINSPEPNSYRKLKSLVEQER